MTSEQREQEPGSQNPPGAKQPSSQSSLGTEAQAVPPSSPLFSLPHYVHERARAPRDPSEHLLRPSVWARSSPVGFLCSNGVSEGIKDLAADLCREPGWIPTFPSFHWRGQRCRLPTQTPPVGAAPGSCLNHRYPRGCQVPDPVAKTAFEPVQTLKYVLHQTARFCSTVP